MTCGDPCNPLKWTCRSLHNIEATLQEIGHQVSHTKIHQMLVEQGYSMQGNQKALEGNSQHPDRDEQFEIINEKAKAFMEMDIPVKMKAWLMWGLIRIQRNLQSRASAGGGIKWGSPSILTQTNLWSHVMAAAATEAGAGFGNMNCNVLPLRNAWKYMFLIIRRAQASGTKLSIACFHTSVRTGGAVHLFLMRSL